MILGAKTIYISSLVDWTATNDPSSTTNTSLALFINKSLFALGIVFIELYLNKPFEGLCEKARPRHTGAGGSARYSQDL